MYLFTKYLLSSYLSIWRSKHKIRNCSKCSVHTKVNTGNGLQKWWKSNRGWWGSTQISKSESWLKEWGEEILVQSSRFTITQKKLPSLAKLQQQKRRSCCQRCCSSRKREWGISWILTSFCPPTSADASFWTNQSRSQWSLQPRKCSPQKSPPPHNHKGDYTEQS